MLKRVYCGCCWMIWAYQASVIAISLLRTPVPWYHPLEHRWLLERWPHSLAMNFYGVTLYASIAAAAAYGFGYWLGGRLAGPLTSERAWLWLGYALTFLALAMAMIAFEIWPRPATPIQLPAWYHSY